MPGTQGSQKRASDPLYLELLRVVSYYMGIRNQTWVLYKYKKMFLISEPSLQLPSPNLSEKKLQEFLMCPKIIKYCAYIYFNLKL